MPAHTLTIVGSYLSPYVRKVLVCLDLKGLNYEIDPIVPYYGNQDFERVSPLRRIPVLFDGDLVLSDSTVICEYLEDAYPHTPLMPAGAADKARARWMEEFADSRMGEVMIWHLYNQLVIRRFVWGLPADDAVLSRALTEEIPQVMDYLESALPQSGYLFGHLSVADISIASFFRNAAFSNYAIDADRWPITAAYVDAVLKQPSFGKLSAFEKLSLTTPIPKQRDALRAAGAPISAQTYGTEQPRPGILST